MRRIVCITIIVLAWLMYFQVFPVSGRDLGKTLEYHKKWLETGAKQGVRASMRGVNLSGVDLSKADLSKAILIGADLSRADLSGADLSGANLSRADLIGADLSGAELSGADLSEADLSGADLSGAGLRGADLNGAILRKADLSGADLSETDLKRADLTLADLRHVVFEPKIDSLPQINTIAWAFGLDRLRYNDSSNSIEDLRDALKKAGKRRQERDITYAIQHSRRQELWRIGGFWGKFESLFSLIFLELTCQYGRKPVRALAILILLIPFFSIFYFFALETKGHKTGIWLIFPKDSLFKVAGKKRPFKLTAKFPPRALPRGRLSKTKLIILRLFRRIKIAFYFSLVSALSIGWREFNLGNYLSRLQRREFVLRATGWVRTVSGIQSIISIYLLAIWIVTFFIGFMKGFE